MPNQVGTSQVIRFAFMGGIMVLVCCFASFVWAQQAADVTYFESVRVKPVDVEKYETTLKHHWTWHEKQGEKWSYFVWTVDSGKNEGAYQIGSFGHTWNEVDESNALVAGTPGPDEDPEPYQLTTEESYFRYRPDLSSGSPTNQPLAVAAVNRILLKPEAAQDFEVGLRRIKKVLSGTNGAAALSAQWYELVTGGDRPQFLLIEERRDWAGFAGAGELDALRTRIDKSKLPEETVKSFWGSIRSIYAETWHYRSDLSRLRK